MKQTIVLLVLATLALLLSGSEGRKLADLGKKWGISEPQVDHSGVEFDLDYKVSDFITDDMVTYSIWDENCEEGGYEVTSGFITTKMTGDPSAVQRSGDGERNVELHLRLEADFVDQEEDSVFFPRYEQDQAEVRFCVRFNLRNDEVEVNFLEMLVILYVDLVDGFNIEVFNLVPKADEEEIDEATGVEGYFCDSEGVRRENNGGIMQGQTLQVCVVPDQRSLDMGFKFDAIEFFDWIRVDTEGNEIRQAAVEFREAAGDGLTELVCTDDGCKFETLLKANFYSERLGSAAPSAAPSAFNEFDYCAQFLPNVVLAYATSPDEVGIGTGTDAYSYTRLLYNEFVSGNYINFNDDQQTCTNAAFPTCTTRDHPSCNAGNPSFEDNGGYVMSTSGNVDTVSGSNCCTANSCASSYLDTAAVYLQAGDKFSYTYKAVGGGDWYEAAIVLFKGQPPARIGVHVVDQVRVVRGQSIADFKTESFIIDEAGDYFMAFFTGSYDRTGGGALGAQMELIAFSYKIDPFNETPAPAGSPTPAPGATPAPTPDFCQNYDFGRRYLEDKEQERKERELQSNPAPMVIGGSGIASLKFKDNTDTRRTLQDSKTDAERRLERRKLQIGQGKEFSVEGTLIAVEFEDTYRSSSAQPVGIKNWPVATWYGVTVATIAIAASII